MRYRKVKEKETTESTDIAEVEDAELVEVDEDLEGWQISDYVDSWAAQHGFANYVYSYKQGARVVVGLSARAYEHLALNPENPITVVEETEEITTVNGVEGVLTKVKVEMTIVIPAVFDKEGKCLAAEKVEKITRVGKNFSPVIAYGKFDEFVFQKSSTKAFRNAVAKCVPATKQEDAKQELLKLQGGKPANIPRQAIPQNTQRHQSQPKTQQKTQQQSTQSKKKKDDLTRSREAMFARYPEVKDKIVEWIPEADFWNEVRSFFKVESRADMTKQQFDAMSKNFEIENQSEVEEGGKAKFGPLVMTLISNVLERNRVNSDESESDESEGE